MSVADDLVPLRPGDLEIFVKPCELASNLCWVDPSEGSRLPEARDPPGLVRRALGAGP